MESKHFQVVPSSFCFFKLKHRLWVKRQWGKIHKAFCHFRSLYFEIFKTLKVNVTHCKIIIYPFLWIIASWKHLKVTRNVQIFHKKFCKFQPRRETKKTNRCQFHQHFTRAFFVQTLFRQLFSSYMYVEKQC